MSSTGTSGTGGGGGGTAGTGGGTAGTGGGTAGTGGGGGGTGGGGGAPAAGAPAAGAPAAAAAAPRDRGQGGNKTLQESVGVVNEVAKNAYVRQNDIIKIHYKNKRINTYRRYYKIGLIITLIVSFISLILLFTGWELNKNRTTDFNGVSYANFGFTGTLVLFLAFIISYYHHKENMNGLWNYDDELGKNLSKQITYVKRDQQKAIENLEKSLKRDNELDEVVKKLKTGTIYKDGQAAEFNNGKAVDLDSASQLKYMLGQ